MAFNQPIAYFITFSCYGSRLHGDERGSIDATHNVYGTPFRPPDPVLEQHRKDSMDEEPLILDAKMRGCVYRATLRHLEVRQWHLYEINVRTNHVHVVVKAAKPPGKMMGEFKSFTSRALRENDLIGSRRKVWAEGGSKKHLFTMDHVNDACEYVKYGQGPDLPME
jgi:REP element-mobilizing transposase RayT